MLEICEICGNQRLKIASCLDLFPSLIALVTGGKEIEISIKTTQPMSHQLQASYEEQIATEIKINDNNETSVCIEPISACA